MSYLDKVKRLQDAYPALIQLVNKLVRFDDQQSQIVKSTYSNEYQISPGRCAVLEFNGGSVHPLELPSVNDLQQYFRKHESSILNADACRLFILEDLQPDFIELLGGFLGVDPLVFAEQANARYFTDSQSFGHRQLPSLIKPQKSFTLRYHEIRKPQPGHERDLSTISQQTTFAINRRRYEPWIMVESPIMPSTESIAVVRRCASFWTSQEEHALPGTGWNAVLLVDPPMEISRARRVQGKTYDKNVTISNYIFKTQEFTDRGQLWKAETLPQLVKTLHSSEPYHKGPPTLYPLRMHICGAIADEDQRDLTSPFDETIFYWKDLVTSEDIQGVQAQSVNSTTHLLKFIAHHWINTLELISYTLAQNEYFSDYNPASSPKRMNPSEWKREFNKVLNAKIEMNRFRRRMIHLEDNMELNLERLGTALDVDIQTGQFPLAVLDAQKDFKVIASRLRPLCERANDLPTEASDFASMPTAFQAIEDSASGLSLNILATVILPFTLVASMLSMPDPFKPGGPQFWIFFAASIPLTAVITLFLLVNQNRDYWHDGGAKVLQLVTPKKVARTRRNAPVQSTNMA